jgi:TolB-like protein
VLGVVPFQNRTGDGAFDWYGEGLARLVADGLAQSRNVRVASADSNDRAQIARTGTPRRCARRPPPGGIRYLLTGDLLEGAGGPTLAARLVDTKDGHELSAGRVEGISPRKLVDAVGAGVARRQEGIGDCADGGGRRLRRRLREPQP